MKKIIFLIAIFTGIIAFGQQEHSGGIPLTTGFKLEDPQPIDDKYVVADSASLHSLPNVYEGLWSYSKADSAIFVYDGVKWKRIATGGDLSEMDLQAVLNNGNIANTWFQLGDPDSEFGAMQYFDNQFRHIKNDHIFDLIFPDFDEEIIIDYPKKSGTIALIDDIDTALEDYIPTSQKGANNGVATLDGGGKIPAAQLPNSVMTLEGEWNASTNTPTLADGVGNAGQIYEVTTAGTIDLGSGDITFAVGDYVVYGSSGVWYKSVNSNAVTSVNGQTGVVNLGINSLSDTPANFTGAGGKILAVNSGATGVEYRNILPADFGSSAASRVFYSTAGGAGWDSFTATASTTGLSLVVRTAGGQGAFSAPDGVTNNHAVTLGYANTNYQPLDGDLTSIAGLSGTSGLLRKTAANTWSLDTNTYATTGDLGDYVPLGGTEEESPITGTLEIGEGSILLFEKEDSGLVQEVLFNDLGNYNTVKSSSYESSFYLQEGMVRAEVINDNTSEKTVLTVSDFGVIIGSDGENSEYVLPNERGELGQTLITDGNGNVSWGGGRIIIPITDDFTLPAMSSPPNQNSFSPITILEDTELPDDHIDWEITWKDSGYTYKLSSLGDFNTQIRESGGDIQIGGQTRSASDIVIDADTMEPVLILKF